MKDKLPEGWILIKFGDVVEEVRLCEKEPLENGLEKYIGLEHLDPDSLKIKRWGLIKEGTTFTKKFIKGHVLFGRRRAYQRKIAIADFDGLCSGDIMIFSARKGLIPNLLPFIIQSENFYNLALDTSAGSLSPRTKWSLLAKFEFPLPPFDVQKHIADLLWAAEDDIRRVDDAIAVGEKYKRVLMKHLLTRGIGHKRFKDSKIGRVPDEWKIVMLKEIVANDNSIVAGPFGSNLKVSDYQSSGVPIIQLHNIDRNQFIEKEINYISQDKADELSYHSYLPGDIVLAKLGDPIGKTCVIPETFNPGIVVSDVVRIRVASTKANREFIVFALNSDICSRQFIQNTIGTTRPRVNLLQVRKLLIPLPPVTEQRLIAKILTNMDITIKLSKGHKEESKLLKKRLLNSLLSGELLLEGDN